MAYSHILEAHTSGMEYYLWDLLQVPRSGVDYIENILCGMADKQDYIAIMDDWMIHGLKGNHLDKLEALFQVMIKQWTEIISQEMPTVHEASNIHGKCIPHKWLNNFHNPTPFQNRSNTENCNPPTNVKGCKSFCRVVNYLSIFTEVIETHIYDLTKKGRPFVCQEEEQQAFDTIKKRMINPPILYLPKPGGRFILYCDSSRIHTGSSIWQVQEGKSRLIGYASKSLPAPVQNYSVTELEMTGIAVNIHL